MRYNISISELEHDEIVELLSTSTYDSDWLSVHCAEGYEKEYSTSELNSHEDILAEILEKGGKVEFTDHEEDKKYEVDLKGIKKGLRILAKKYPKDFFDFINEDSDYYTCNNAIQCVLFKDVIYG